MIKQKNHIKKGDLIKVIAGSQKNFIGKVHFIFKKKSIVILEDNFGSKLNKRLKNSDREIPFLIHSSNIMLFDSKINKASRIGYKTVFSSFNNIEKKRYFKKSEELI